MNRGKKWFSEKLGKKFGIRKFSVRVDLNTYLLYRELPLLSSCCKGEACLPRSHNRGETSSPELCIESSRFQARVAKGTPAFRDHITGGKLRVQNCVSRAPVSKLVLQRGGLPSEITLPGGNLESRIVYQEVPLPSSCCKGEACLPRSHYRRKPRVQN